MKFRILTQLSVLLGLVLFAPFVSAEPLVYVVTLSQQFGTLDLATGRFHPIGSPTADSLSNLVWAPNGYLYTLTVSGDDVGSLATINPVTGEVKDIGPTGLGFNAFDLAEVRGKLYATDFSNNLYSIDRDSGIATPIADTGMPPDPTIPFTYNSDGTFNVCDESLYEVDGKLYATFDSFAIDPKTLATPVKVEPALYQINPLTGATKHIAATDLKLSASVEVEGKFYAFRGVLTGFDGFPQAYSQVVRLDLETGKTTWAANIDPSVGLILGAAPVRFTTIDFPGATLTEAWGINPRGDIVGLYTSTDKLTHGFVLSKDGDISSIDFPDAVSTEAFGINSRGDIVGDYTLADGTLHAYLLSSGEFSTIDFPDGAGTSPGGINPSGEIVGLYVSAGLTHGFLRNRDSFSAIDFPGAIFGPPPLSLPPATLALGINSRGDIVGGYRSAGVPHAFLLSDGEFTSFDFPDAAFTTATGINPRGDIVGRYTKAGVNHGYILSGGEFSTIDCPDATFSGANAINRRGDIVGRCTIAAVRHGFLLRRGAGGRGEGEDGDGPRSEH